jgi:hypothetical protein
MLHSLVNSEQPSVGIFWGFEDSSGVVLAIDATPLKDAEPYGEFLTHPRGHYEVWEWWKSLGAVRLKKMDLPTLIMSSEYEAFPRGRLVFDTTRELYIIYADLTLQKASTIEAVIHRFGLAGCRTAVRSDSHYVS